MNKISFYISKEDDKNTCKEILMAIKLITLEKESLTKLEPNYNWEEIKGSLSYTKNQNCKDN